MDLKFSSGDFLTGVCSCLEESVFYFVPNRDFGPDGGSRYGNRCSGVQSLGQQRNLSRE